MSTDTVKPVGTTFGLTMNELKKAYESLKVIEDIKDAEFSFNYEIAKLITHIEPIVTPYEESFNKFIIKYGTIDDQKKNYKLDTKAEGYLDELQEINDTLSDVHDITFTKIPKEQFMTYKIKAKYLKTILWLIEE